MTLSLTLDASGHNLQGKLDLNLPFPCSDSTLTGSLIVPVPHDAAVAMRPRATGPVI